MGRVIKMKKQGRLKNINEIRLMCFEIAKLTKTLSWMNVKTISDLDWYKSMIHLEQ